MQMNKSLSHPHETFTIHAIKFIIQIHKTFKFGYITFGKLCIRQDIY